MKSMNPRTVEDVIMDFKGRRAGIIKALTKDVEKFYQLCDPNYPNLCLYGYPNQQWEVNLPPPSDLPEPRLGINFSRDAMKREDWLSMVALHSDAWLHALVAFLVAKLKFDKADRKRLFNKIADFPSIFEVMSREVAMKRVRIENCGLPEEILIEVLSRVSVKDLIRYRSVSKTWRSIIDDSSFVSTHLNNYKSNLEGNNLLVMEIPRSYLKDGQVMVRRSDTYRKVVKLDYLDGHKDSCCLSYINGVMLLLRNGISKWLNEIVLWNPSINRSLSLPNYVFQSMKDASYFELGFGFDASHNDYKVIAIVYPHAEIKYLYPTGGKRCHGTVPGLIQVYSLSSNSWSSHIDVKPPPYWTVGTQVFVNGAIHWTNLGPNIRDGLWNTMRDSHIVSFDVANEIFNYFELPRDIVKENDNDQLIIKDNFLTVLDGSLAMLRSYEYHNDIWMMKEYGAPESWSKLYTFTREIENLLYFKSNGELLFAIDGKGVQSYDVKRKRVRDLAKTYCKTSKYRIYTYVESLVLLGR